MSYTHTHLLCNDGVLRVIWLSSCHERLQRQQHGAKRHCRSPAPRGEEGEGGGGKDEK